jgi:GntR family transcriptional regulator
MISSQSERSQLPLHLRISEKIREWICIGQYLPGERLPSEHQLMEQFDVSRITVRRALSNLVHQGLIVSRHGKGAFVKEQQRVVYSLSSPFMFFDEDMARKGLTNSIKNLVFKSVQAPKHISQVLNLSERNSPVYWQKKLFSIEDVAVAMDVTYIVSELGQKYATELKQKMTFPVLEQHGIPLERLDATISCRQADYETSQYLELTLGSPLLVYSYTAYTTDDKPIVYGETLSSGDRLCYSVTLTERDGKGSIFGSVSEKGKINC